MHDYSGATKGKGGGPLALPRFDPYNVMKLLLSDELSPPNPPPQRRCRATEPAVHAAGSGGVRVPEPDASAEYADAGQFRPADGRLP